MTNIIPADENHSFPGGNDALVETSREPRRSNHDLPVDTAAKPGIAA